MHGNYICQPCPKCKPSFDALPALIEALKAIARYGENGICPFGCDTPYIAQLALASIKKEEDD